MAKPMKLVVWKIVLSGMLVALSAGILFWRIADPSILDNSGLARIVYLVMALSFVSHCVRRRRPRSKPDISYGEKIMRSLIS